MDDIQSHLYGLDNCLSFLQNVVLSLPRSDPGRTLALYAIAQERAPCYSLSMQPDDLEPSILRFTELIFLPLPWDMQALFPRIFWDLAFAVSVRAGYYRRPEDIKFSITVFRYLHGQPHHKVQIDNPHRFAVALISALALQVVSSFGDVDQDVEEMADLCDKLLNSDIQIQLLTTTVAGFAEAIHAYLGGLADDRIPSDKVIDCLRKATVSLPHLQEIFLVLATSLFKRWLITPSDDDREGAFAIMDKLISFRAPDGTPNSGRAYAINLAFRLAIEQWCMLGRPQDLEQAIYRIGNYLDEIPCESHVRDWLVEYRSDLESQRLLGSRVATQNTMSCTPAIPPSFQDLSAALLELNETSPSKTPAFKKFFDPLLPEAIRRVTDMADIQDGIHYCRQVLASYSDSQLAMFAHLGFTSLSRRAFMRTDQIEYLNDAISATRYSMNTVTAHQIPINGLIIDLIDLLGIRLHKFRREEDVDEFMRLCTESVKDESNNALQCFKVSCTWAFHARCLGHHSTSMAYDHAMSSMQAFLTVAPTLTLQHSQLVHSSFSILTLIYASYQIHTGQLKQAIETLERGRALLWSELRGLRTSIDPIHLANPRLAEQFADVNKELEALTLTILPDNSVVGVGGGSGPEGMDPYGRLVLHQRKLLDNREKLISKVQALPGFDTFLKPPSFDTLHSAASHGPVIIITHSRWRSDIIILLHNAPPSHIPTSDDFYSHAIKLQYLLLEKRGKGLGSNEYENTLRWVLKELYDLVGQPVIRRLNELGVPKQSRVWWCPTSVFCSLPLHAMGPIPSEVGPPRYFLDLFIPSYTPSLSALIETRKPSLQTLRKPSMRLVAQPDASMAQGLEEMQVVQAVRPRPTTLMGATATPTTVLEHLRNHQFVHFVCHGILEPGMPFDSSFKLYQGKSLSLLDIVRSQLPDAEFAFLAACHTAELTHESPADEALHLAAAMQYCGFRSVVGTMWAMADADGPDLARNFYGSLFSGRKEGVYHYERTAEALRQAVVRLRRKSGITLERWVNYVHYGA